MKKEKQELRFEVQMGAYKNEQDDYAGKVARIEVCNKCCGGKLRAQFFSMGNNELLENFNLERVKFFIAPLTKPLLRQRD